MKKKFVHYIHIDKNWYYWIDEFNSTKTWRPYEGDGYIDKDLIWFAGEDTTKSKAKEIISEMFPQYTIIKTLPYHHGTSPNGSRPIKYTVDKKGYKKIRNLKRNNFEEDLKDIG